MKTFVGCSEISISVTVKTFAAYSILHLVISENFADKLNE